MRERPDPGALSPRALAWLRGGRPEAHVPAEVARRAADGWVPQAPETSRHAGTSTPRVRLPSALAGARWQPGRAAVLGVVLVAVVAALVLGLRVAWAGSDDGDVVAPGGGARAGPSGVSAGAVGVGVPGGAPSLVPGDGPSASPSPSSSTGTPAGSVTVLVVHVVGQVRRPGLQRLPPGSRVSDAVDAAGGATKAADLSALNLARLLVDGEQVRVPKPGEVVTGGAGAAGGGGSGGGASAGGAAVSLSTADVTALDGLPGIGPVLAQRIVDWRTEHGRFTSVDELAEVSGIGEKVLAQLRPLVVP
ncbi:ComEA family DNA-binding protein [Phycicoccus sonneratiae]|uniref:ComEA family DNA-binding protein n=1 Tax=Phycicoccus sonneratiae TaxID=2807628 RepID=A0ABS2CLF8_9MICO|nr:ComEA family DNA-binding protein [Phycicoccus sonneraticus]MBM6400303.1 ComEA family DNA-binding protein [Phycicoccus sonneraticus]